MCLFASFGSLPRDLVASVARSRFSCSEAKDAAGSLNRWCVSLLDSVGCGNFYVHSGVSVNCKFVTYLLFNLFVFGPSKDKKYIIVTFFGSCNLK